jgi:LAGLIDADG DNA endonuclease family
MDSRPKRKRRNENLIPCACDCGELIYEYGTDGRIRRYARGHQFKGNTYGAKPYDRSVILQQAEPLRPNCSCGCGEQLVIPLFLQQKGKGLQSIQRHWIEHPYLKGHGLWDKRTQNFLSASETIDETCLGLVYGTLLGDASIGYPNAHSCFPRLAWTHGIKQLPWLQYKTERLSALRPKLRTVKNEGYGDQSSVAYTQCHPELTPVFAVVKPTGDRKVVTRQWLDAITPEGMAWWYMDDGSLSISSWGTPVVQLHTEGFSDDEQHLLAEWLLEQGYKARLQSYHRKSTGKQYCFLVLNATSSRQWIAEFKSYSIPTMDYKFRDC